jgi:hypothetical protein
MNTTINIPLSKNKLRRSIIISAVFILLGIFMFFKGGKMMGDKIVKKCIVEIAGALLVPLCCWTLYYSVKKLKDEQDGLNITDLGIYDNCSGANLGLIKWEDITGFKEYENRGTKSIFILVDNPDQYISKANSFLTKKILQANYKMGGTPIAVSAVSLSVSYEQLKEYILTGDETYRKKITVSNKY